MWVVVDDQNVANVQITTLASQITDAGCLVIVRVDNNQPTVTFIQGVKIENGKLVNAWDDGPSRAGDQLSHDDEDDYEDDEDIF